MESNTTQSAPLPQPEVQQIFRDRQRLSELERWREEMDAEMEAMRARMKILEDGDTTKEGKVAKLVEKAENLRKQGQRGVSLSVRDIVGATGVCRRYAYDLIDGDNNLPSEYHWILTKAQAREQQYGSLEIDASTMTKGLVIDFERLHSDQEAVNKFTTRPDWEVE